MTGAADDEAADRADPASGAEPAAVRPARPANKRGVARLAAVQGLYQMDVGGGSVNDVVAEFEAFRLNQEIDGSRLREADIAWFRAVLAGVVADQRAIDRAVDEALAEGWPLKRIDLTLRAVLRAGVYELTHKPEVPGPVAVSEYVDVAKAFFDGDEPRIVNAVLDRIGRTVRPRDFGSRPASDPEGSP